MDAHPGAASCVNSSYRGFFLAVRGVEHVALRPSVVPLCHSLAASLICAPALVKLEVTSDDSRVNADTSVSFGLLVTELVINVLKACIPGRSVGDDGVGMGVSARCPVWSRASSRPWPTTSTGPTWSRIQTPERWSRLSTTAPTLPLHRRLSDTRRGRGAILSARCSTSRTERTGWADVVCCCIAA